MLVARVKVTLPEHGFQVSMIVKGNCYDNAVVETFFETI